MIGLSIVAVSLFASAAPPVTTAALIEEMIDLHRLARFPAPAYKIVQFSSHDRRSTIPAAKGWFANADGFGDSARQPNFDAVLKPPEQGKPGEFLMCDIPGPGALVRLWTASIGGTLRVYLDDAQTPLYDGPAEPFFHRTYDPFLQDTGIGPALLAGAFYQRDAAYAPIPFRTRCRIVWIGDFKDSYFYHVQARVYESDAAVTTFTPADLKACADLIRRVAAVLADVDKQPPSASARAPMPVSVQVPARGSADALVLDAGGAIERLTLKLDAPDIDQALRQTALVIRFDDAPWGQVQAPIGDFFGAGPGVNPFSSLPFTVAPDGTMTCRFVMPFQRNMRMTFENHGLQPVTVNGSVTPNDYRWDDGSMHFRARWRVDHGMIGGTEDGGGAQDVPFLLARGRGVYVGTAVMLMNPAKIPASWGSWWGEGDEKIFVDGDAFPAIFGTGSEDYFNYSWSATDVFGFPYCGQARNDGPGNRGFVANYRWHVLDPIPFAQSLAFYMELLCHDRTEGFSYGRIGYCYGREGMTDDVMPLTDPDLQLPALPPDWQPEARIGAAGCVFFACEELAAGPQAVATHKNPLWQGGAALVWTPQREGETLSLKFQAQEEGKHTLTLACMASPGAGAFEAALNGTPLKLGGKQAVSLDIPHGIQSQLAGAGIVQLKKGENVLALAATSAGKPVGLDFLAISKR